MHRSGMFPIFFCILKSEKGKILYICTWWRQESYHKNNNTRKRRTYKYVIPQTLSVLMFCTVQRNKKIIYLNEICEPVGKRYGKDICLRAIRIVEPDFSSTLMEQTLREFFFLWGIWVIESMYDKEEIANWIQMWVCCPSRNLQSHASFTFFPSYALHFVWTLTELKGSIN